MKEDWIVVRDFKASDEKDCTVEFTLSKKDWYDLEDHPEIRTQKIRCRLVCVELENGEKEYLCTSLTDSSVYLHEDFKELYHFWWNIEENYKLFKSRLEIENFSGKKALAVQQDFHAKVFMMNLCTLLAFPIEERVRKEYEEDKKTKHTRKINRTFALGSFNDVVVALLIRKNFQRTIEAFDQLVERTTEIIRPNRTFTRSHKQKRIYNMNYKGC